MTTRRPAPKPAAVRKPAPRPVIPEPAPAKPPKVSLEDFAKTQRPGPREVKLWFEKHPGLSDECRRAMIENGYSDHLIHKWLKAAYEFPFSVEVARGIRENRY